VKLDFKKSGSYLLMLAALFLGLVFTMQVRSIIESNRQETAESMDAAELKQKIEIQVGNELALKTQIEDLTLKRDGYIREYLLRNSDSESVFKLQIARLKAGLLDVKGPGIILTLDDAPARVTEEPNLLIIHDTDIRKILNELKKAGAQAISINDERITSTSEQICAGPTIRINGNRYSVPYVVKAIGDPDALFEAIETSERIRLMKNVDISVSISKQSDLLIKGFTYSFTNPERLISGLEAVEIENR
jgi:uncharacterized protein YlxW (UPF0749 family)